ncbi:MAG: ATP-binding cassette domain-containing protein [Desulfuromonadaceae bacterium]
MTELLSLHNLQVSFPTGKSIFLAVRGISLSLAAGSVLALVGESGSGKSMTALSIMRLVPPPDLSAPVKLYLRDKIWYRFRKRPCGKFVDNGFQWFFRNR